MSDEVESIECNDTVDNTPSDVEPMMLMFQSSIDELSSAIESLKAENASLKDMLSSALTTSSFVGGTTVETSNESNWYDGMYNPNEFSLW